MSTTRALEKPLRSTKLSSSLGGLCTGQSARMLGARAWVGQLGCWAQRVGHEFDPVMLVRSLETN